MKKLLLLIMSLSFVTAACSACDLFGAEESSSVSSSSEMQEQVYNVTFIHDGKIVKVIEVKEGESVEEKDIPAITPKTGYTITWEDVDLSNIYENINVKSVVKANTYTITYDANGGTGVEGTQEVTFDSNVTLPIPNEREGFTFVGWEKDGVIVTSGIWSYAEDVTLVARWIEKAVKTYTITFKNAAGLELGTKKVPEGGSLTVAEFPTYSVDPGYTYSWSESDLTNVTSDMTVTLTATPKSYNIIYKIDGETVSSQEVIYKTEYEVKYPTPSKDGYHLTAWTPEGALPSDIWSFAGDMVINAAWEINVYTVIFMDGNNLIEEKTVEHGQTVAEPTFDKDPGYTYTWDASLDNITDNITASLVRNPNKYTITYDPNGATSTSGSLAQDVYYKQAYTLEPPEVTKDGFTFAGWTPAGEDPRPLGTWDYAGDMTLVAQWEEIIPNSYIIKFVTEAGDLLGSKTVIEGDSLLEADFPTYAVDPGYTYSWSETELINITSDKTVTLSMVANQYTIDYQVDGSSVAQQTVTYKTEYALEYPVLARDGYHLTAWTPAGTLPNGVWDYAGNMIISAAWEINVYIVTFKDGDTVLSEVSVEHGAALTDIPEFPADAGYTYKWSVTDFAKITADLEVILERTANQYMVIYDLDGGSIVSGSATEIVTYKTKYTLTPPIVEKVGYNFDGWIGADSLPEEIWDITSGMTLTAKWEKKATYKITFVQDKQATKEYTVEEGTNFTDIPTPAEKLGYRVSWDESALALLANVQGDVIVNAVEIANIYVITYVDEKDYFKGTVNMEFNSAYDWTLDSEPVAGYRFVKFTLEDGTEIPTSGTWTTIGNVTVVAVWEARTYTVVLKYNDGASEDTQIEVTYGQEYTLPTLDNREGYTFKGWRLNGNSIPTTGTWKYTAAGTIELVAAWQSNEWTNNY